MIDCFSLSISLFSYIYFSFFLFSFLLKRARGSHSEIPKHTNKKKSIKKRKQKKNPWNKQKKSICDVTERFLRAELWSRGPDKHNYFHPHALKMITLYFVSIERKHFRNFFPCAFIQHLLYSLFLSLLSYFLSILWMIYLDIFTSTLSFFLIHYITFSTTLSLSLRRFILFTITLYSYFYIDILTIGKLFFFCSVDYDIWMRVFLVWQKKTFDDAGKTQLNRESSHSLKILNHNLSLTLSLIAISHLSLSLSLSLSRSLSLCRL